MSAALDNTGNAASLPHHILVVDDEPAIRDVLRDFLVMEGYEVTVTPDGESALDLLAVTEYDAVVTDLKMRGVGGIAVLEATHKASPSTPVVLMTGFGTVETAIEAMKKGAFDFLLKPFKAPDLVRVVHRAIEHRRLQLENLQLRELVQAYHATQGMGQTLSLEAALDLLITTTRDLTACCAVTVHVHPRLQPPAEPPRRGRWRPPTPEIAASAPLAVTRSWARDGLSDAQRGALDRLDVDAVAAHLTAHQPLLDHGADAQRWLRPAEEGQDAPLRALVALPLRGRDGILGVVLAVAFRHNPRFSEERRQLLQILTSRGEAALENVRLHEGLKATLRQTIQGLVNILEAKDPYTRGHSERVKLYAGLIAEGMELPAEDVVRIEEAALVHDIGKLCIRQEELNKPGPLSPAEYEMFKSHTTRGKWLLEPIEFLHALIPSVYHHHERWDGRGYPMGLAGEDIPKDARIMAVADCYDAMTSNRPYRRALPHAVAVEEIRTQAGQQFDPEIAEVFVREIEKLKATQRERRSRWVDILEARGKRAHIPGYTDAQRSATVLEQAGETDPEPVTTHQEHHEPTTR